MQLHFDLPSSQEERAIWGLSWQVPPCRSSANSCSSWICLCSCTSCNRDFHNPIRSSQFNYLLCEKILPPSLANIFLPDNFIECSLLHPSVVSSVWGEMSGVYLLCAKCLAEVVEHFGSPCPGILASAFPQLSQEREKPPKNEVPGCSQLFSPFT